MKYPRVLKARDQNADDIKLICTRPFEIINYDD